MWDYILRSAGQHNPSKLGFCARLAPEYAIISQTHGCCNISDLTPDYTIIKNIQ